MGAPLPPPDEVRAAFSRLHARDGEAAVAYLHALGTASGYLKADAARAIRWTGESAYGTLECTINLAKPEKDPRAITAAASKGTPSPERMDDPASCLLYTSAQLAGRFGEQLALLADDTVQLVRLGQDPPYDGVVDTRRLARLPHDRVGHTVRT